MPSKPTPIQIFVPDLIRRGSLEEVIAHRNFRIVAAADFSGASRYSTYAATRDPCGWVGAANGRESIITVIPESIITVIPLDPDDGH